jgi:hypothetical protein
VMEGKVLSSDKPTELHTHMFICMPCFLVILCILCLARVEKCEYPCSYWVATVFWATVFWACFIHVALRD